MEKLPIDKVLEFEANVYKKLDSSYKKLNAAIIKKQALDDEIEKEIKELIGVVVEEMGV